MLGRIWCIYCKKNDSNDIYFLLLRKFTEEIFIQRYWIEYDILEIRSLGCNIFWKFVWRNEKLILNVEIGKCKWFNW